MMEIKKNKCPNCGATLHYNKRMNRYECHYCSAVYDDTNKNDVDNRVELSPDELADRGIVVTPYFGVEEPTTSRRRK